MRVVKEGKRISNTMLVTCKTCGAQLEIVSGDLRRIHGDRPFDPDFYNYKCVCCKHHNYLVYNDLSSELRSATFD